MNILPNELILLDDNLRRAGVFSRLDTRGTIAGHVLREHDYDKLIVTHKDTVADALREAGLIDRGSTLRYLGKILAIDVLFAEVEQESGNFRRFVVVEDKLFSNPEARREVLGQILDYKKALNESDVERLSELLPNQGVWLETNEDLVNQALQNADFLLLVCGDRIQSRLVGYVEHLKEQLDPLISADIALMSLAIFTDGTHYIFVPYVVSLVTAERGITIKVVVQDARGEGLAASTTVIEETEQEVVRRQRIEVEDLLSSIREVGGEAAALAAQELLDYARELGAQVRRRGASVSVRVRDTTTGKRSTVFVLTKKATFYIGWLDSWVRNAGVNPEVAKAYREQLTEILGRSPIVVGTGGTYAIPLTDIGKHLDAVKTVIQAAIQALRHTV
jgi:hypothetical protein